MTDSGFELMRHALGVEEHRFGHSIRYTKSWRNHFVAAGDHVAIWDDLVAKGFAMRRNGSALSGGDPIYFVTDSGREAALDGIVYKTRWGYGKPKNP